MTVAMRFGSILAISGVVLALDQLTKAWFLRHLELGQSRAVTSFLHWTLTFNTGSAFGFFQGNNKALLILAIVILVVLLYCARGITERGGLWGGLGVALVLGGAAGNLIDRLRFGHVVDFIDFGFWPVFNIADSAIAVGAALLAIGLWRKTTC